MGKKLTINDFIIKARKIHGNKFNYDKAIYVNCNIKLEIVCPIHGSFWQIPYGHCQGKGCPACGHASIAQSRSYTAAQFIKKAKSVHGDKYIYDKVKYKPQRVKKPRPKVIIICPVHGNFLQAPTDHLGGAGCLKCAWDKLAVERMKGKDSFIAAATRRHGSLFDYSEVVYKKNSKAVAIRCTVHGLFYQTPRTHLRGSGCPQCARMSQAVRQTKTLQQFIQEAKKIHKNKYNYSKVLYKKNTDKICIICPIHGEFEQTASDHLYNKSGCPPCAYVERNKKNKKSHNQFVNSAKKIHNDFYDYSLTRYERFNKKIKIICPVHGVFEQIPAHHSQGSGCPSCKHKNEGQVYLLLKKYLTAYNIERHKPIYRFSNGRDRRCDFWITNCLHTVMLEYDGEMHFMPVLFGKHNDHREKRASLKFKRQQEIDALDREFCDENDIILWRIRYDEDKKKSILKLKESLDAVA